MGWQEEKSSGRELQICKKPRAKAGSNDLLPGGRGAVRQCGGLVIRPVLHEDGSDGYSLVLISLGFTASLHN